MPLSTTYCRLRYVQCPPSSELHFKIVLIRMIDLNWLHLDIEHSSSLSTNADRQIHSYGMKSFFFYKIKKIITQPMKVLPIMSQSILISIHFDLDRCSLGQTIERNWFSAVLCIQIKLNKQFWWKATKKAFHILHGFFSFFKMFQLFRVGWHSLTVRFRMHKT